MNYRFLFYWVNVTCDNFTINVKIKLPIFISSYTTKANLSFPYLTIPSTRCTQNLVIRSFFIKDSFFCHTSSIMN